MRGNLQYSHTVQKKYIMRMLSKLSIYALISSLVRRLTWMVGAVVTSHGIVSDSEDRGWWQLPGPWRCLSWPACVVLLQASCLLHSSRRPFGLAPPPTHTCLVLQLLMSTVDTECLKEGLKVVLESLFGARRALVHYL